MSQKPSPSSDSLAPTGGGAPSAGAADAETNGAPSAPAQDRGGSSLGRRAEAAPTIAEGGSPLAGSFTRTLASVGPIEWTCLGYLAVTSVLVAFLWARLPVPWLHVVARLAWVAAIVWIVRTCHGRGGLRGFVRIAYPMLFIPMCYAEVPQLIDAWGRRPLDAEMMVIDEALFGVQPCIWLHPARHPLLTDVLMVIYVTFLPLPVLSWAAMRLRYGPAATAAGEQTVGSRPRSGRWRLHFFSLVIAFGFLSSYVGYLAVPVRGPCHDLLSVSPMPEAGVVGRALQDFISMSRRGDRGVYDGFPSGHTIVSILLAWAAWRVDRRQTVVLIPLGALIILSTLYLQYHYAIDLLVGVVWAVASMPIILWMWRRWERSRGSRLESWGLKVESGGVMQ